MKKIITFALVAAMTLNLAACGSKTPGTENPTPTTAPNVTEQPEKNEPVVITPALKENMVAGNALWNAFLNAKTENAATTPEELANLLSTNSVIQFMAGAMPVEPGFLQGFGADITGFESGAMFGPMMGSIAFIGYVFNLAEGSDVAAFIKTLEDNCNPRWNICVSADYTLIGAHGNTVFFLMYPATLDTEAPAGEDSASDEAVIIAPTVAEGTWGETLWNYFVTSKNDNPSATAVDSAFVLAMHESIPFMAGSMEVFPGFLQGFDTDITDFKSAGFFGPMMGSIAFAGYVFELEEGADVNAFMTKLSEQANPSWNVCVTADQTVIGAYNNTVFFLMCPTSNQGE